MPAEVWEAIERGDADTLERLLRERPELAASRDEVGVSLLLRALHRRRNDLAGLVLSANPPLDGFDASALNDVASLDELLVADPDLPHKRSGDGLTALHLAAMFGAERAAARLLDAGADPGLADDEGLTALDLAERAGYERVAAALRSG